jgi:hypothetical protein
MRVVTRTAFGALLLLSSQSAQARIYHQRLRVAKDVAHDSASGRAYAYASATQQVPPGAFPLTSTGRDMAATRAQPPGAAGR